ncbi:peptidylprolyl isomerase [Palleronia sp. LCG004]|uniref:peptidylprolyl isomerase n=1 Tax=Palleronia sp. LCG004 TaxID=3079304 RepID=UPI002941EEFD|nr:peptidyl-prolyl cis-trans isomerase [Palleronia sp. LCG004]WOI56791.1 peptidyl-prolyl cis-trans isomerase [Palleronia sp. LCG004]
MAKSAGNAISKGIIWVVLLLLIVGLAGFGATNFGGSVREVGRVGDTSIDTESYARALQQEIRGIEQQTGERLSFAEAQQYGLDGGVLQRLLALAALEDEADELGLSVGDGEIRNEVMNTRAFQGADGSFDRQAYEFALGNAGISVADYEEGLREEISRSLLQGALVAGIQPPAAFVDTLYTYAREMRDLSILVLGPDDLDSPIPEPSDGVLRNFYDANQNLFTLPERKRITYAWLTPEMVLDETGPTEEDLRALYEDRASEYNQPERRLAERLVFSDPADAEAAAAAIESGETDFDTLVADRGLTLDDVDLGEVSRDDLGDVAAEAVFDTTETGIVGPVESDLGAALYRVNAILRATETPFEDVEPELRAEFASAAARRRVESEIEPVEDLLAGGATLEEIGEETPFETNEIFYSPELASVNGQEIDAYETFREIAGETEIGDFPTLYELADGGLFALRVDEVVEPTVQPLEDVRDQALEAWRAERLRTRLADKAEAIREALAEGAAIEDQDGTLRTETGVLRDAFFEDLPSELATAAFTLNEGGISVLTAPDGAVLLRVDAIEMPDPEAPEAQEVRRNVTRTIGQGIAQDVTEAFTRALETEKGIQLNQQAVQAVNSQFN